jgi:hypothetical protein
LVKNLSKGVNMKRTMIFAAVTAFTTVATAWPAAAQHQNRWDNHNRWHTVGYTQVNGRDNDTVRVRGTARYRQMRLCVYNGPIRMRDLDVRFRNGGHQDVAVRYLMRAGTCTRNLDLRGNRRDITAVRLKYSPSHRSWVRPVVRVQVR